MMPKDERNTMIRDLYLDGMTQEEIANRFHLSAVRVGVILANEGVTRRVRGSLVMLGVRVTPGVKEAVTSEARKDSQSVSEWVSDLIVEELRVRGVSMQVSGPQDTPLPFEGDER